MTTACVSARPFDPFRRPTLTPALDQILEQNQALREQRVGVSRNWWDVVGIDMTGQEILTWGSSMRWVLRLIEADMPSGVAGVDVMEISRPDGASNIADLALTLSEAKQLLACVQQAIVAASGRPRGSAAEVFVL